MISSQVLRRRACVSMFAIVPLWLPAAAMAQDAADLNAGQPRTVEDVAEPEPAVQPELAQSGGLEEIVITAERREQRLQDVPISATVLSADEIARRGVEDVSDIQQVSPSI